MGTRQLRLLSLYMLVLAVAPAVLLSSCGPVGSETTPVPSATTQPAPTTARPAPSSTLAPPATPSVPWPTPRPPTPSPTPLGLVPTGYPPLPAGLYFLRQGRLWRWPAQGGPPEMLAPEDTAVSIVYYTLSPDRGWIAYLTGEGRLFVLDEPSGRQQEIPLVRNPLPFEFDALYQCLRFFGSWGCDIGMDVLAFTPDNHYLLYLDWQAMPTATESLSGTLRAADLQSPGVSLEIAPCGVHAGLEEWRGCRGFRLSPDGSQVAFIDGQGLWIAQVPGGPPLLLRAYEDVPEPWDALPDHIWTIQQWSPDGRWLLASEATFETVPLVLLDVTTGEYRYLPHAVEFGGIHAEATWGPAGVWVGWGSGEWGALYLAQPGEGDTVQVTLEITATEHGSLWPRSLYALPDGRVAFANQRCVKTPGPQSGLFFLQTDGRLDYLWGLPMPSCDPRCGGSTWACCDDNVDDCFGQVWWSPDGRAFLYEARAGPTLLGWTDGSAVWDVRAMLAGATLFRWAQEEP